MKGFTYPGESPAKAKISLLSDIPKKEQKVVADLNAPEFKPKKKEGKSDLTLATDFVTKPTLYKGRKLTLRGNLNPGEGTEVGWDTKGKLTKFGSPTIDLKHRAGLSGDYNLGKRTTLSGGVDFATGLKPTYRAGLKINI